QNKKKAKRSHDKREKIFDFVSTENKSNNSGKENTENNATPIIATTSGKSIETITAGTSWASQMEEEENTQTNPLRADTSTKRQEADKILEEISTNTLQVNDEQAAVEMAGSIQEAKETIKAGHSKQATRNIATETTSPGPNQTGNQNKHHVINNVTPPNKVSL
ncbi:39130_t:CDS:1, partial [Gigaspora margarita]